MLLMNAINKSKGLKRWQSIMAKFMKKHNFGDWDDV